MTGATSIMVLLLAAILEAGGDALMRSGLHKHALLPRVALMLMAGAVLFAYGWTVNAPPWDFGKLIGIYVVFFFLVAESISWVFSSNLHPPLLFWAEHSS